LFPCKCRPELEFRLLERRDAEDFFQLNQKNMEYLIPWMPRIAENRSIAFTEKIIDKFLDEYCQGIGFRLGIWQNGQLVGYVGLINVDRINMIGNVSCWIDHDHQGQGIFTTAIKVVVNYGFDVINLNKINWSCAVGNNASQHVAEKLGFSQDGLLRQDERLANGYVDHVINSVLKSEWENLTVFLID